MLKTNFQKVQEFNRAFDMAPKNPYTYTDYKYTDAKNSKAYANEDSYSSLQNSFIYMRPELFIDSPHIITLRLALIDEEVKELNVAITNNDIIETRDALADILYVVYGIADVLGIDIDNEFNNFFLKIISNNNILKSYTKTECYATTTCKPNINTDHIIDLICTTFTNRNTTTAICNCYNECDNICLCDTNCKNIPYDIINLNNFNKTQILIQCIYDYENSAIKNYYDIYISDGAILQTIQTHINNNYKTLEKYCKLYNTNTLDNINKFKNISNYINNILRWVYSYIYLIGYYANTDFDIVHNSNMNKLCDTLQDAQNTVIDYNNKFMLGLSPYDSPYYYELPELKKWIVKNKSTGKALKNIKYQKVIFN